MKAVMITIRLWYFYLTYKGIKTVEVRKTQPKDFKGNVYECVSKTNWKKDLRKIPEEEREFFKKFVGKVGLKFTLNKVDRQYMLGKVVISDKNDFLKNACLTSEELNKYLGYGKTEYMFAWHIDNLETFDEPKGIIWFKPYCENLWLSKQCRRCKYYFFPTSPGAKDECLKRYLFKAPQSWCYVVSDAKY